MSNVPTCDASWPVLAPAVPVRPAQAIARAKVADATVAAARSQRIDYIDAARGLFVIWMVTAHALTLAAIPGDHLLQWLRPRGWSTVCFVMLSGFSIAMVLGRLPAGTVTRKLWRRAGQLLVIAFLSNIVSLAIRTLLTDGSVTAQYLVDVVRFRVPWSISGVLIATTIVVLVGPALLALRLRLGGLALLLGVVTLNVAVDVASLASPSLRALVHSPDWLFSFPVLNLALYALTAFALAPFVTHVSDRPAARVVLPSALAVLAVLTWWRPYPFVLLPSVESLARFLVALGAALVISRLRPLYWVRFALGAIGRTALLLFLLHRPLLQTAHALVADHMTAAQLAIALMGLGWTTCVAAGIYRLRTPALAGAMHRVGL